MQRARLPRRTNDCPEAHGSTRDCGRTKACKYLTNDYIRKRLEWICKNFLKVLDCENGTSCIGVVSNAEKMQHAEGDAAPGTERRMSCGECSESVTWRRVPQEGCLVYLVRHQR